MKLYLRVVCHSKGKSVIHVSRRYIEVDFFTLNRSHCLTSKPVSLAINFINKIRLEYGKTSKTHKNAITIKAYNQPRINFYVDEVHSAFMSQNSSLTN